MHRKFAKCQNASRGRYRECATSAMVGLAPCITADLCDTHEFVGGNAVLTWPELKDFCSMQKIEVTSDHSLSEIFSGEPWLPVELHLYHSTEAHRGSGSAVVYTAEVCELQQVGTDRFLTACHEHPFLGLGLYGHPAFPLRIAFRHLALMDHHTIAAHLAVEHTLIVNTRALRAQFGLENQGGRS